MNIGKLYTYNTSRRVHETVDFQRWFVEIRENTPFIILGMTNLPEIFSGVVKGYKVLTSDGEIGWISGIEESFKEI